MISFPRIHQSLEQLGYGLVGEQDGVRHYQLQGYPAVNLFMDFQCFMTLKDLQDVLESHGVEIVEPFFAMYNAL